MEKTAYLLPAVTVLLCLGLWLIGRKSLGSGLDAIEGIVQDYSASTLIVITLLVVTVMYILAHGIDTASDYVIERFLVDRLQGMPHERVVPEKYTTEKYKTFRVKFQTCSKEPRFLYEGIKVLVFWFLFGPLLMLLSRHEKVPELIKISFSILGIWVVISFAWVLLLFLHFVYVSFVQPERDPKNKLNEKGMPPTENTPELQQSQNQVVSPPPEVTSKPSSFLISAVWIFITIWCQCFDFIDRVSRRLFYLDDKVDVGTFEKFVAAFEHKTSITFNNLNSNDRFWVPYFSLIEASRTEAKELTDIWQRAIFCRNQAVALFLSAAILSSSFSLSSERSEGFFLSKFDLANLSLLAYFSAGMFMYRFFQHYFSHSKMLYRAYSAMVSPPNVSQTKPSAKKTPASNAGQTPKTDFNIADPTKTA